MMVHPRHVLCVLGNWKDFATVQATLAESFPDFSFDTQFSLLSADARMTAAFNISAMPARSTLGDDDHAAIRNHRAVAYILSPPMPPQLAEDVSSRALRLVALLLDRGGVAAKSESAGLAHGRAHWKQLAGEHATFRARGDYHSARVKLYFAWVQGPILDRELSVQYTVGMHLLGLPDTEIESALDFRSAVQWLDLMGLYLSADRPTRPVLAGEGFRLAAGGLRRIIEKHPCTRYQADDFFFNPYGYNRLVTSS